MTITLTREVESAIAEQARRQGTTPESLVSDSLQKLFAAPKPTPDEILGLAAQVYAGLSEQEVAEVERVVLGRAGSVTQR